MADWIKGAIKHPSSFKKTAHKAGLTTAEAADKWANKPGKLGQRARLAQELMGFHHKSK